MTTSYRLAPPLPPLRAPLQRLADSLHAVWLAIAAAARAGAERRRLEREIEAFAELNDRTLDDIGACDWVRQSARARRDSDALRDELPRW